MTDTTNKLRAVFLTALMIGSVFAAGIAFSGSVAAASNTSISASPDGADTSAQYTITTTVDGNQNTDYLTFDIPGADFSNVGDSDVSYNGDISTSSSQVSVENGELSIELADTANPDNEQVTVTINNVVNPSGSATATLDFETTTEGDVWDTATDEVTISGDGASARTTDAIFDTPTTAFLGEENVDISGITSDSSATFSPTGDSGTSVVADDVTSVDFTSSNGFDTGVSYNVSGGDGENIVSVREASISDVTLETENGADVTNGRVIEGSNVTVIPEYNFENADQLAITIEDSEGFDVTEEVLQADGTTINSDVFSITSGGEFTLGTGALDTDEQYNVTLEGDELDSAHTVSFTIGDTENSISLDSTEVTQGENVRATVLGAPGETVDIRVENDSLTTGSDATDLFANTGDVENRSHANDYAFATIDLGDDGEGQVRIKTGHLDSDTSSTFEVIGDVTNSDEDDSVELRVNEQAIAINNSPGTVAVGSDFMLNGTAPEVDEVGAYVKLDNKWHYVNPQTGEDNPVSVEDGEFELELTASDNGNVLNIPGSYRLGVAANVDSTTNITQDTWNDLTTASTTINTGDGDMDAAFDRNEIANDVADEVDLTGYAVGQGNEVRMYQIGPRGTVNTETVNVESDNSFETSLQGNVDFPNNGQYQFLIIGEGRDGNYAYNDGGGSLNPVSGSATQQQALAQIEDAYTGSGEDDVLVNASVSAQDARISIDQSGNLEQSEVTISGTTNREPDTTFFVDVTDSSGQSVTSTEAEVGSNGTWETTLDLSQVELGGYTLTVDGEEASATQSITVVEQQQQTTQEPEQTTQEPEQTTEQQTTQEAEQTTEQQTTEATDGTTEGGDGDGESGSGVPGFGMGVALIAVLGAALLALRQN